MKTSQKIKLQTSLLLALLLLAANLAQGQIQSTKLKDGVERWYRVKTAGQKPWFFQQVENLFNVALPSTNQLPFGVSVAFLVGVSQYDFLEPDLPFVKNDVEDMRQFLLNQGGFDTVYVAREKIVNRDLIEDYMRNKLGQWLRQRDRLLFYYAGHGADNRGKTGYMQFAQAQPGNFAGPQVLKINDVSDWSSEIKLDHLLFIFDCCASGLAFEPVPRGPVDDVNGLIATLSRQGSRSVVTAGTADERTYEVETAGGRGNGVFTRAFLNAAETGSADKGDGFMTIDEIVAQTKNQIAAFAARNKQSLTPRLWPLETAQYRGTFVFVNPEANIRRIALASVYAEKLNARPRGEVVAAYGLVRIIAFLSGQVYIDNEYVDNIEKGVAKEYPVTVGSHKIEVRGASETVTQTVIISKGQIAAVTIKSKTTPAVVTPPIEPKPAPRYSLRRQPQENLSEAAVKAMLRQNNFYSTDAYDWTKEWSNPQGKGLPNEFELQQGGKVVYDRATGLMWQQSGSPEYMTYERAKAYVAQLNKDRFAGYNDWRLPTLEEAMSLMEPKENSAGLYIDSKFDNKQMWIWTADTYSAGRAWYVDFHSGGCNPYVIGYVSYVRAVRP
ncbi:MAG: DUF1566 domain-containing protein [candidate division KSB1 bacterium]|nr:DUF1566 domain-containing protein [candidate division KSB1 bacterium]